MPISQFSSPATLSAGKVHVNGSFTVAEPAQDVEFRFMIVQNDVVAEGQGRGENGTWAGTTNQPEEKLEPGPAQAIGLAFLARRGHPLGYETLTWSSQIELELQESGRGRA